MWELRRAILKAQNEKPPNNAQSTGIKTHKPPLKRKVTTCQNTPQSDPAQNGRVSEPDENPPLIGRVTEPKKSTLK